MGASAVDTHQERFFQNFSEDLHYKAAELLPFRHVIRPKIHPCPTLSWRHSSNYFPIIGQLTLIFKILSTVVLYENLAGGFRPNRFG